MELPQIIPDPLEWSRRLFSFRRHTRSGP